MIYSNTIYNIINLIGHWSFKTQLVIPIDVRTVALNDQASIGHYSDTCWQIYRGSQKDKPKAHFMKASGLFVGYMLVNI